MDPSTTDPALPSFSVYLHSFGTQPRIREATFGKAQGMDSCEPPLRLAKQSAGLLLYRAGASGQTEVLLVHPGGPFWAKKDLGAWSIPKGEHTEDEDPRLAAVREFVEELGIEPPAAELDDDLGSVRQSGGKVVRCWGRRGSIDVEHITSNTIEIPWPPRSGKTLVIPEVDRAEWFVLDEARQRINQAQVAFLDRLVDVIGLRT